ncbi:hypothetical protein ELI45_31030 (plasmid) [Rhizobium ruizarguesonis]|uniref:hypothetical protein n=1 Tax=Rhizobium TaxID=379 RepID=UPI00041A734C|nr:MULTISPECIES: hypothetical protein [Rhizobium]TAU59861.1 hypothetical protein ELI45_31030 [Rhizobium ruizarguesonis]
MVGKKGRKENEFAPGVKRIISDRANLRCIVPGCKIPTKGPGARSDQTASIGTACHIYSAAPDGPRGQGGLSTAELAAPENGVWACATHGRLIDTNDGGRFPSSTLKGWKSLQEAQIKKEQDHINTSAGWLDRIKFQNSPLFAKDAELVFGKHTLLRGPSVGKTTICQWLEATFGRTLHPRWQSVRFLTAARCYVPERKEVEATFGKEGPLYRIDGREIAEFATLIGVVHLKGEEISKVMSLEASHAEILAKFLGIEPLVVKRLVPDIQRNGSKWGRDLVFVQTPKYLGEDEDDGLAEYSTTETIEVLQSNAGARPFFNAFSSGELANALLDFSCALARERSKNQPTVLIIDGLIGYFGSENADEIGRFLSEQDFQILLTAPTGWRSKSPSVWNDWLHLDLVGEYTETKFEAVKPTY